MTMYMQSMASQNVFFANGARRGNKFKMVFGHASPEHSDLEESKEGPASEDEYADFASPRGRTDARFDFSTPPDVAVGPAGPARYVEVDTPLHLLQQEYSGYGKGESNLAGGDNDNAEDAEFIDDTDDTWFGDCGLSPIAPPQYTQDNQGLLQATPEYPSRSTPGSGRLVHISTRLLRANTAAVVNYLRNMHGAAIDVCNWLVPDLVLGRRAAVLYATPADLVERATSDRLVRQLADVRANFDRCYVVLECSAESQVKFAQHKRYHATLAQLALSSVITLTASSASESAALLGGLLDAEIGEGFGCPANWPALSPAAERAMRLLSHLPGLGNCVVARTLLHAPGFTTLRKLMLSGFEALRQCQLSPERIAVLGAFLDRKYAAASAEAGRK
jgi:ERCC4-type nuclease